MPSLLLEIPSPDKFVPLELEEEENGIPEEGLNENDEIDEAKKDDKDDKKDDKKDEKKDDDKKDEKPEKSEDDLKVSDLKVEDFKASLVA